MPAPDRPRRAGRPVRRAFVVAVALAAVWAGIAYLLAPAIWKRIDGGAATAARVALSVTAQGIPGDPINLAMLGGRASLFCAMAKAGWRPADPVTLRSSLRIVSSVLLHRAYAHAPVSPLFWSGKRQDFAFEKGVGGSAKLRHHVRFWETTRAGAAAFVGSATFDRAVGVSHYTGQVTHHIGADVDSERDALAVDLAKAGVGAKIGAVVGLGPTDARNGGGDPYSTDGAIDVIRLDCAPPGAALAAPAPAPTKAGAPTTRLRDWLAGAR
ncbi:MAG: LssY C-terminal domain-containing protein [Hyphomicrobiales bacterium]|nr:LssY C-terminal domain-containing protein [Hyphomicrobiales bacterium]MDE2016899.1 LssY C-terminal domain-containing protein [Hyphomicrobiales bacterium]